MFQKYDSGRLQNSFRQLLFSKLWREAGPRHPKGAAIAEATPAGRRVCLSSVVLSHTRGAGKSPSADREPPLHASAAFPRALCPLAEPMAWLMVEDTLACYLVELGRCFPYCCHLTR